MLPARFFVTGTDTDVGKTFVSALLMSGMDAAYWKPVQCGFEPCSDTEWIQSVTGLDKSRFLPERHKLRRPLSPHLASQLDGVRIRVSDFVMPDHSPHSHLIIEGAGGVLVPINERHMILDLIHHLKVPALIVARSMLGTINHTLSTIFVLRAARIEILGVVMNGPLNEENKRAIEHFGKVPVLAQVPKLTEVSAVTLFHEFQRNFQSIHANNQQDLQSLIRRLEALQPELEALQQRLGALQPELEAAHSELN